MPTYGQRPDDVVIDSRGNALSGVLLSFYPSESEALAGGTAVATATTDVRGRWRYETTAVTWARLPDGTVWRVSPDSPTLEEHTALEARVDAGEALTVVSDGSTVVTDDGTTAGQLVGYWVTTQQATINGVACAVGTHVFGWDGSAWDLLSGGGGDSTPPTAGTLTVTGTDVTTIDVSVSGALDDTALDPAPYSFSDDDGASWSAWQAGSTYQFTGLTESTSYYLRHRVRDAVGLITEGATVTDSTTANISWAALATWDFTAAENTELNGLAPSSGSGVTLTAPATDLGLSPPRYVRVQSNKAFLRHSGLAVGPMVFTCATANPLGIGVEYDFDAAAGTFTAPDRILVGTNSGGTNQVGFTINSSGAITSYHLAAGSTSYTAEPGAPTVVPKTCTIRAEFTPGGGGSGCTGRIYIDGVLYGSITSSGWTWQGKHIHLYAINNQQVKLNWDNLTIEALA